jgi:hypothetical protein
MGIVRNHVAGSVSITSNQMADADAIEINSNQISVNLVCFGNSMAWDSNELGDLFPRAWDPNTVGGQRVGQCVTPPPLTEGGQPAGPPGSF